MKYISVITNHGANNGYRLFYDLHGNIGLNIQNSSDPLPWYILGNWEEFKQKVDDAIVKHKQAIAEQQMKSLETIPTEVLKAALDKRNVISK